MPIERRGIAADIKTALMALAAFIGQRHGNAEISASHGSSQLPMLALPLSIRCTDILI